MFGAVNMYICTLFVHKITLCDFGALCAIFEGTWGDLGLGISGTLTADLHSCSKQNSDLFLL